MRLLYTFFIRCYSFFIYLAASLGNKKAKLWCEGRKNQWDKLKSPNPNDKWIWMHVSSLGEFEQGLPVMEALKRDYPQY
ncbi:MAG: 3-deoxy-D-manno-octulosonic acid transferase, partial [Bacteroidales bacterium]|nr:3-deoxy-D-manno-octulosonic acid transferase [Bacteroidales bacterium]